ncbi:MAG: hypothetical protein COS34_08645 [Lysobacterales bacterium CG02_land_8_20_14_3_00_62_12]|nr:MAG: hypothetical protein COS34_08645 [Xanthomonadales bacterium CG02_land_8_20_14_3_00_62_12]PJA42454.1 MAG: hypothetical protein CO182_02370 [Xanthomonadales bacterium CG_4_9_14_3_um_filter_62_6]
MKLLVYTLHFAWDRVMMLAASALRGLLQVKHARQGRRVLAMSWVAHCIAHQAMPGVAVSAEWMPR